MRNADARNVVYSWRSLCCAAGQHAVIEEMLQHEEAGDVGFGFFDGAVEFLQFLARRGVAPGDLDLVRADAVRHLVRQDVREEGIEAEIGLRRPAGSTRLEIGTSDAVEIWPPARSSASRACSLLLNHALVVRQIVSRGLHAVVAVAGGEDLVHHADGRGRADLRIAILRIDRQVVLDLLQVIGEELQLARFPVSSRRLT